MAASPHDDGLVTSEGSAMSLRARLLLLLCALGACTQASADERGPGWEMGLDVIYQDAQAINFDGDSQVRLQTDYGISAWLGYRFNTHFDMQWTLDWNDIDYKSTLTSQSPFGLTANIDGTLESFTTRFVANYNILDRPLTPYVTAGIGWAFVDTNVPTGPPQSFCWWDPWWGPVCGAYQNTRSFDEFAYNLGVGARWDLGSAFTLRLAYEQHWIDFSKANSTPTFDQVKLGFAVRY
jgi:opacity protein-like surface antigen